jgi:hypothetical protein
VLYLFFIISLQRELTRSAGDSAEPEAVGPNWCVWWRSALALQKKAAFNPAALATEGKSARTSTGGQSWSCLVCLVAQCFSSAEESCLPPVGFSH